MPPRSIRTLYELDLLENGLDFIKSGIDLFYRSATPKPRAHKYALLHIFSGMLLILKERLARVRPSLVFVNESQAGQAGAKTTDYHRTLQRLDEHGIRVDPARRAVLDEVRDIRNAIEHYRLVLSIDRTTEAIGEMVSFLYSFCRDELQIHIDDHLSGRARDRFYGLKEVGDRIYADLVEDAEAEAAAEEAYFRRFEARYTAMAPEELLQLAREQEGAEPPAVRMRDCPSCGDKTLLLFEVGVCVNPSCRATYLLDNCRYCLEVTFSGERICKSCLAG
jgi:hypothetical protein